MEMAVACLEEEKKMTKIVQNIQTKSTEGLMEIKGPSPLDGN